MPFVLGASIAACWAFEDEDHPVAALALERMRSDQALVPSLWWFEVRNTLIVNERRGRLAEADTAAFLRALSRLGVVVDRSPEDAAVLTLSRKHRLTVYDASYLELAYAKRCRLRRSTRFLRARRASNGFRYSLTSRRSRDDQRFLWFRASRAASDERPYQGHIVAVATIRCASPSRCGGRW